MEFTVIDKVILFPLIFLAGFVDSIAGGGGLISLPAYLFIGVPSHYALGTNKLSSTIGTIFSTLRYAHGRTIVYSIGIPSVVGSLIGSYIGSKLALFLSDDVLKIVLAFLIPIAAVIVFLSRPRGNGEKKDEKVYTNAKTIIISALIGLAIGTYDGFFGPGTGTFLIIFYVSILSLDHVSASGTAKIVNLASNIGALVTFIAGGKVFYSLGLPAALFGIAGNWLGSGVALKRGAKVIKPVMLAVLILLFIKIITDMF